MKDKFKKLFIVLAIIFGVSLIVDIFLVSYEIVPPESILVDIGGLVVSAGVGAILTPKDETL